MKPAKKLLLTLITAVILPIVIILTVSKFVTPESAKAIVNRELPILTNQTSHVNGEIDWQLLPRPGIRITRILIGPSNPNSNYAINISKLFFNLQIMPLLKGQLVFNEMKIDGLIFSINSAPQAANQDKPASEPDIHQKNNLADDIRAHFAINSILLTHGQLVIWKEKNNIRFTELQLGAEQLNLKNESFPLQLKSNLLFSLGGSLGKAALDFKGKIQLNSSILENPIKALENANINGHLLLENARFKQVNIGKISSNMLTKKGEISLNPLYLSLYNGESLGDLSYQIESKKLTINQTASRLDAKKFLNDLWSQNSVQGILDFSLHLSTVLEDKLWQNNIRGNGNITVKNGLLFNINLPQIISGTAKLATKAGQNDHTKFELLSIQYRLLNAKFIYDSLLLQTSHLQLKGKGEIDLKNPILDNKVSVKQNSGESIPLRVKGTIMRPQVLLDLP